MQLLHQNHVESCSAWVSQSFHPFRKPFSRSCIQRKVVTELSILNTFYFYLLSRSQWCQGEVSSEFHWPSLVYLSLMILYLSTWTLCYGSQFLFFPTYWGWNCSPAVFRFIYQQLMGFLTIPPATPKYRVVSLPSLSDHLSGLSAWEYLHNYSHLRKSPRHVVCVFLKPVVTEDATLRNDFIFYHHWLNASVW